MMEGAATFASATEMYQHYADVKARLDKTVPPPRRIVRQLPPPPKPVVRPPGGIPLSFIPAFLPKLSGCKPVRSELLGGYVAAKTMFIRPGGRDWLMVDPSIKLPGAAPAHSLLWQRIVATVARKHKVLISDIMSPRRNATIVVARQECFWRLRNETTMSLPQIGRKLGRDHTTVMHGIAKHQARLNSEAAL